MPGMGLNKKHGICYQVFNHITLAKKKTCSVNGEWIVKQMRNMFDEFDEVERIKNLSLQKFGIKFDDFVEGKERWYLFSFKYSVIYNMVSYLYILYSRRPPPKANLGGINQDYGQVILVQGQHHVIFDTRWELNPVAGFISQFKYR